MYLRLIFFLCHMSTIQRQRHSRKINFIYLSHFTSFSVGTCVPCQLFSAVHFDPGFGVNTRLSPSTAVFLKASRASFLCCCHKSVRSVWVSVHGFHLYVGSTKMTCRGFNFTSLSSDWIVFPSISFLKEMTHQRPSSVLGYYQFVLSERVCGDSTQQRCGASFQHWPMSGWGAECGSAARLAAVTGFVHDWLNCLHIRHRAVNILLQLRYLWGFFVPMLTFFSCPPPLTLSSWLKPIDRATWWRLTGWTVWPSERSRWSTRWTGLVFSTTYIKK